jgi:hypothetical protein
MLHAEAHFGWGVKDLLAALRSGTSLLKAQVPGDMLGAGKDSSPTVAALLKRSTDLLDVETRRQFAYLGFFVPKPATFDLEAMAAAWDVEDPRPPLLGKLVDLLLVFGFGLAATLSLALSLLVRLSTSFADSAAELLGTGAPLTLVGWAGGLAPVALSLAIFALLFRLVPARATTLRDTWPGVLFAAAGFEAAKGGFSFYLEHFARYDAVYASLGSVIAFLVFVWIAANVLLLGAEVASEHGRMRDEPPEPPEDGPPLKARVARGLRGLVVRPDARPSDS